MSDKEDKTDYMQLETEIVRVLKTIYDPEIPVNLYDLGLIYEIDVDDENKVKIVMTLTAPNCPIADSIINDVEENVGAISSIESLIVELTFEPPWDQSMMSDEARLELGFM